MVAWAVWVAAMGRLAEAMEPRAMRAREHLDQERKTMMNVQKYLFVGALLGSVATSRGAAADEPPSLEARIDNAMNVRFVLKNPGGRDRCDSARFHYGPELAFSGDKEKISQPLPLFRDFALDTDAIVGATWNCHDSTKTNAAGKKGPLTPTMVRDAVVEPAVLRFPAAMFVPQLQAPGAFQGSTLRTALGVPVGCGYYAPGAKLPQDPKKGLEGADEKHPCSLVFEGDGFRARLEPNDVTDGNIAVLFQKGTGAPKIDRIVTFEIASCTYKYNGPLPALVQGARKQRINISSTIAACTDRLWQDDSNKRITLVSEGTSLQATVHDWTDKRAFNRNSISLDVDGIPIGTKTGFFEWKIQSGKEEIGTVRAEIIPKIAVEERLSVVYEDGSADALQDRQSEKGIAVVDPTSKGQITNTATLSFPESLRALAGSTLQIVKRDEILVDQKLDGNPANEESVVERFWTAKRLDATEWTFERLPSPPIGISRWVGESEKYIDETSRISFHVPTSAEAPLVTVLRLYETTKTIHRQSHEERYGRPNAANSIDPSDADAPAPAPEASAGDKVPNRSQQPTKIHYSSSDLLLEVEVKLADRARQESIPLPIANAIKVVCFTKNWRDLSCTDPDDWPYDSDLDIAGRGEQRAIESRAMEDGACWLAIDKDKLGVASAALYGPQSLRVTVHREGADDKPVLWPVNFANPPTSRCPANATLSDEAKDKLIAKEFFASQELYWFKLEAPKGNADAEAVYSVRVEVAAESKQFAVYRTGIDGKIDPDERKVRPEQIFEARLRSRGLFGWRRPRAFPIRTYLTIPVEVSALRFPAASVDLKSTSDSEVIQYVSPRAGILLTVEPWNYDKAQHPWPVPLRLQTGLQLFQFAKDKPEFSYLAGVSAALPIFESKSTQTQTSASIGLFYELDLREINGDFNAVRQSHFLVSLGFNVLSLLGAK